MVLEGASITQTTKIQTRIMTPSDDLLFTSLGLASCVLIGALAFRQHFKKHDELKTRMIPWIVISLGAIATGFMLLVHLVNILGIETGRG